MFYGSKKLFLFIFFIINNLSMYQWVKELPDNDIGNSEYAQVSKCINGKKHQAKNNIIIDYGMPYDNKQFEVIGILDYIPTFNGVMRNIKICQLNKKTLGLQSNSASSSDSDDSYAKVIQDEEERKFKKREKEDADMAKRYYQQRSFEEIISNYKKIINFKEKNAQFFYLSPMYSGYDKMVIKRYIENNNLSQFYKNLLSALNITEFQFNLTLSVDDNEDNIYKSLAAEALQLEAARYFNDYCFSHKSLNAFSYENLGGPRNVNLLFNDFTVNPSKIVKHYFDLRNSILEQNSAFLKKYFDDVNFSLQNKLKKYNIFFNVLYLLKKTVLYSYYDNKIFAEMIRIAGEYSKNFIKNTQLLKADDLFSYKFKFFHKWHQLLCERYKDFFAFGSGYNYEQVNQKELEKKLYSLSQYNFIAGYDSKAYKSLYLDSLQLIMFARIFKNSAIIKMPIERAMTVNCFKEDAKDFFKTNNGYDMNKTLSVGLRKEFDYDDAEAVAAYVKDMALVSPYSSCQWPPSMMTPSSSSSYESSSDDDSD